jgi:hypothetical protein
MATTPQVVVGNRAGTTLAAALSTSSTSVSLVSVAGFPSIASGQFTPLVLSSVTTPANFEIVYITALSGTTATVERAQEGTAALAFNPGDLAQIQYTAGVLALQGQLTGTNDWVAPQTFSQPVTLSEGGTSTTPAAGDNSENIATTAFCTGRLLNVQVFDTAGTFTYTPTTGTDRVRVTVIGGGGGGGGIAATGSGQFGVSGGGQAGAFAVGLITSGFAGVTITVGAAGTGATGVAGGVAGGTSSFGSIIECTGGAGGGSVAASTGAVNAVGGSSGGVATGGNILNINGLHGGPASGQSAAGFGVGGIGGSNPYGFGGNASVATGFGGGGSGGVQIQNTAAGTGGNGSGGMVMVEEFS